MDVIRVVLERGGVPESEHEVHAVCCEAAGEGGSVFGDEGAAAFFRSSMKPFQAMPIARERVLDDLDLGPEALALACASHHGMPCHTEIVRGVLSSLGLEEEALACGPHRPVDASSARALDEAGRLPGRVHNNCSGKHAAMLALARRHAWPLDGYHDFSHPLQGHLREELARWIDADPETLNWGVDGCGVPTPRVSLRTMARAYAALGASEEPAARAVVRAMTEHPNLISGPSAFSAALMSATDGRILAKEGAEGVFCLAATGQGWGAAFKVADGAARAIGPAVLHALRAGDRIGDEESARLDRFRRVALENTRGEAVAVLLVRSD